MFKNLCAGAVGVSGTTEELAALAQATGFGGMDLNVGEAADRTDAGQLDSLRALYRGHGLRAGGFGLPVDFRGEEAKFREGLAALPRLAKAAAAMDCHRCATWILPGSDTLPFKENFEFHRSRLEACARILQEHGCWLGLEFVGPRTSRARRKHEFIWDLPGMLELADAIGTGNVGLLLDCWHWYTSEGTVDDLLALRPEQIVYVHVNDAPAGVPLEEHIDNQRAMPGETGVIDIAGFLGALDRIGFDGPITAEPFNPKLRELPREEAARLVSKSLDTIFAAAGLADPAA
jgi:sugar phosphate isomerase/epimerase